MSGPLPGIVAATVMVVVVARVAVSWSSSLHEVRWWGLRGGGWMQVEEEISPAIQSGMVLWIRNPGCDASVLLDATTASPEPEKLGIPNFPSLRGFEVIDAAKAKLEKECRGVVSCADIVAFAGRDASFFLSNGVVDIKMPAGRYDGRVSFANETLRDLPPPFANVTVLEAMFKAKGLDLDDMVTLSGAHTVGISHCSSFADRLPADPSDPMSMEPVLASSLQQKCSRGGDPVVVQDDVTPHDLDKQYYQNVLDRKVLFKSDAALLSPQTLKAVEHNAKNPGKWERKFTDAMVKMGNIEVKTKANGEIRKQCRFVN
ncbi:unnamed protein product [Triticum turgidum subsp. durum]|uniref:Peroxidase n=1 Tax=Triticum turgidum subsp. durum TaxID=4567 RepID=A0A9R1NM94_TRITD|nr:unnamed protein product [Triticum turgidum subsp. durum]